MTQVSVDNIYQEIGGERQIVGQVRLCLQLIIWKKWHLEIAQNRQTNIYIIDSR